MSAIDDGEESLAQALRRMQFLTAEPRLLPIVGQTTPLTWTLVCEVRNPMALLHRQL